MFRWMKGESAGTIKEQQFELDTTHIDRILTHKTFVLYMLTKRTFIGLVPRSIKPRFFNINQRQ